MNNIKQLSHLYLLLIVASWSCTNSSETEKYQNKRDLVIDVREKVEEIVIEDVLIGPIAPVFLANSYLMIADVKSHGQLIHLFDKNDFSYVTSTAYQGQGPGEIAIIGQIAADETHRVFYVSDHGKQTIFSYDLDSVLVNPSYMPKVKMKMNNIQFPSQYRYVNDTLCIGLIIEPVGGSNFNQSVARWNMNTEEIKPMKYKHPDIAQKRISFAVSMQDSIYAECYSYYDLMTICNLNGNLKYNIYGPNWKSQEKEKIKYFDAVIFCNGRILAAYSGGSYSTDERYPTKFLVFDLAGNYLKTLETGYMIGYFCYDKDNNRLIMNLNDEIQFASLKLDGLIE